jgi:hypothetical protein
MNAMRRWAIVFAVVLAAVLPARAQAEETTEELAARAESARLEQRPPLYTEIARRHLEAASELYTAGDVQAARAAVHNVETYADKAQDAAVRSGKKLKGTEIALRKMASRLRDIKRTLSFEEQLPVQAAIDHLEDLRTKLLDRMFGKKEKEDK